MQDEMFERIDRETESKNESKRRIETIGENSSARNQRSGEKAKRTLGTGTEEKSKVKFEMKVSPFTTALRTRAFDRRMHHPITFIVHNTFLTT